MIAAQPASGADRARLVASSPSAGTSGAELLATTLRGTLRLAGVPVTGMRGAPDRVRVRRFGDRVLVHVPEDTWPDGVPEPYETIYPFIVACRLWMVEIDRDSFWLSRARGPGAFRLTE